MDLAGDRRQSSMDKMDVAGGRAYEEEEGEELDPAVEWKQAGEEQDVVEIRLPGFRKEHVRVQVDNYGVLRAAGARPARGGRWIRFTKDLRLPDGCDADGVRARFEDDKLLITLPIVPADDALSPRTPSPEPLPRTSSFQPPSSVPPPSFETSTANVPEPKSRTLSDIPKSPTLSDIPIAERTKKHGRAQEGGGKVSLPLLEEMKKKEKQKMEGRKAREAANVGSETPPAVDKKREAASKLLPPASKDPTMTTTDLVANMAAAAAVLVGIALSVWRSVSSS